MDVVDKIAALGVPDAQMWADSQTGGGIDHVATLTVLRAFVDAAEETPAILAGLASDPATPDAVKTSVAALSAAVSQEDAERVVKAVAYEVLLRVTALLDGSMVPMVNPDDLMFGLYSLSDDGTDYVPGATITGLQECLPSVAAARLGADVVKL